jgi:molybdopterin biosynthesis enzyme
MKLFRTLISYEEAVRIVLSHAKRLGHEEIRFNEAVGRILAEDIRSPIDSPPFDRAAMDGYAIRGEDSFGASPRAPVLLKIRRGRPGAGETEPGLEVHAGEGIPIATGMPVPKGSNAVVMLEYTRERGDTLEIYRPLAPGRNVSFHGEDVKAGEVVLHAGRRLRAHDIGMLAALFQRTVQVYKRATIGILSTGDELIDPLADTAAGEQSPAKQKIADSNSYMMAALTQTIANPHRIGRDPVSAGWRVRRAVGDRREFSGFSGLPE